MRSDEIRKALFPLEVMVDELKADKEQLNKTIEHYIVETMRYRVLKDLGVVITIEEQGALYLQGEEMDEWFKNRPEGIALTNIPHPTKPTATTKPRKSK